VTPDLAAAIAARAEEIERARSLPHDIVDALIDAGVFRLCLPRAIGGSEAEPAELAREIEAIASIDGSTGWCAMIGATSGLAAAYLPQPAARSIYGHPRVVTGGVFAPRGKAAPVDGGWRLSGRWPFASGCRHCDWLMLGAGVAAADSKPEVRLFLLPRAEVTIHDTWHVAGLAGTGSHDVEVVDRTVAAEQTFSLTSGAPWATGRLYGFPAFGLLAVGIAAVALGIAAGALGDFRSLARGRTPTLGRRTLAERGQVQATLAEATAMVDAGRAYLHQAIGEARPPLTIETRARLRLAATHATRTAADAVSRLHQHAGGGSLYLSSPLQRRFRDVHAATQHMMVGPATLELVGRLQFGLDTDTAML
jgi:indole-3-acetate monooxygenase